MKKKSREGEKRKRDKERKERKKKEKESTEGRVIMTNKKKNEVKNRQRKCRAKIKTIKTVREIGLSLFNGISTFVGYLIPKPSF